MHDAKKNHFGIFGFGLTYKRQISKIRLCFADISWDVIICIYLLFALLPYRSWTFARANLLSH